MKTIYKQLLLIIGVLALTLTSCDDFLDREPLDQIGPNQYLSSESDLASFPINYYNSLFSTHGGWSTGIGRLDDHTDNQATSNPNLGLYEPGNRLVPENGDLGFATIRAFNFFLQEVLPKRADNAISGNTLNIDHYIGEVYMLRAMAYFDRLKTYGDYPIVTTVLPDQEEVLVAAAERKPRNLVARQIISDLDSAILLMQNGVSNKTRLTKDAALLAKSRVALYEASFLTYHRGTPRVPGESGWPGASLSYNSGFSINLDQEINWLLDQAMEASKQVADKIQLTENSGELNPPSKSEFAGWNPYFDMFSARDMGKFDEILFWRQYDLSLSITHGVTIYIERGANTGLTKGFVDGFLMRNGLPIYAQGSDYQGDTFITDVKENRDERLQLFLFDENDPVQLKSDSAYFTAPLIINLQEVRDVTGYRSRKFMSYDPSEAPGSDLTATAGSPIFRAAEAYLNYIEASYMKKGTIDADADRYWKALRTRAGVDADYTKTIAATDMNIEAQGDWGAYSAGTLVDPTLYNIRRERRNEYLSEGIRYADLIRWRSMDQVKNYVIEGFNLWEEAYKNSVYTDPKPGEVTSAGLIDNGSSDANVSSRNLSTYLRPYQILNSSTNTVFNGYNWSEANYLSPIPYRQMQLASPDGTADNSNLYQNPYWPVQPNAKAER
ncbi:MAG: RagB/SusD family nutrient uptake outer membrane protein [Fermentimonas sp.]|nr:RagB/SusD family nutrient uptake outer membrane protein [Fermentimonas sp.]